MPFSKLEATYRIHLSPFLPSMTVQLWRHDDGHLSSSYTHDLQTPWQTAPTGASPGRRLATTDEAIRDIVVALQCDFRQAIAEGYAPDNSWIVPVTDEGRDSI